MPDSKLRSSMRKSLMFISWLHGNRFSPLKLLQHQGCWMCSTNVAIALHPFFCTRERARCWKTWTQIQLSDSLLAILTAQCACNKGLPRPWSGLWRRSTCTATRAPLAHACTSPTLTSAVRGGDCSELPGVPRLPQSCSVTKPSASTPLPCLGRKAHQTTGRQRPANPAPSCSTCRKVLAASNLLTQLSRRFACKFCANTLVY